MNNKQKGDVKNIDYIDVLNKVRNDVAQKAKDALTAANIDPSEVRNFIRKIKSTDYSPTGQNLTIENIENIENMKAGEYGFEPLAKLNSVERLLSTEALEFVDMIQASSGIKPNNEFEMMVESYINTNSMKFLRDLSAVIDNEKLKNELTKNENNIREAEVVNTKNLTKAMENRVKSDYKVDEVSYDSLKDTFDKIVEKYGYNEDAKGLYLAVNIKTNNDSLIPAYDQVVIARYYDDKIENAKVANSNDDLPSLYSAINPERRLKFYENKLNQDSNNESIKHKIDRIAKTSQEVSKSTTGYIGNVDDIIEKPQLNILRSLRGIKSNNESLIDVANYESYIQLEKDCPKLSDDIFKVTGRKRDYSTLIRLGLDRIEEEKIKKYLSIADELEMKEHSVSLNKRLVNIDKNIEYRVERYIDGIRDDVINEFKLVKKPDLKLDGEKLLSQSKSIEATNALVHLANLENNQNKNSLEALAKIKNDSYELVKLNKENNLNLSFDKLANASETISNGLEKRRNNLKRSF